MPCSNATAYTAHPTELALRLPPPLCNVYTRCYGADVASLPPPWIMACSLLLKILRRIRDQRVPGDGFRTVFREKCHGCHK